MTDADVYCSQVSDLGNPIIRAICEPQYRVIYDELRLIINNISLILQLIATGIGDGLYFRGVR